MKWSLLRVKMENVTPSNGPPGVRHAERSQRALGVPGRISRTPASWEFCPGSHASIAQYASILGGWSLTKGLEASSLTGIQK